MPADAQSYVITAIQYIDVNPSEHMVEPDAPMTHHMVEPDAPTFHRMVEPDAPIVHQVIEHETPTPIVNIVEPNAPIIINNNTALLTDLTVMAVAQDVDDSDVSLINRMILDPGSNIHVINSDQWVGWVP